MCLFYTDCCSQRGWAASYLVLPAPLHSPLLLPLFTPSPIHIFPDDTNATSRSSFQLHSPLILPTHITGWFSSMYNVQGCIRGGDWGGGGGGGISPPLLILRPPWDRTHTLTHTCRLGLLVYLSTQQCSILHSYPRPKSVVYVNVVIYVHVCLVSDVCILWLDQIIQSCVHYV